MLQDINKAMIHSSIDPREMNHAKEERIERIERILIFKGEMTTITEEGEEIISEEMKEVIIEDLVEVNIEEITKEEVKEEILGISEELIEMIMEAEEEISKTTKEKCKLQLERDSIVKINKKDQKEITML